MIECMIKCPNLFANFSFFYPNDLLYFVVIETKPATTHKQSSNVTTTPTEAFISSPYKWMIPDSSLLKCKG